MSRPSHRGRQQADIGEHREAAADAGVVIEHGDAMPAQKIAQAVALAGDRGLGEAEKEFRQRAAASPACTTAASAAIVCISVSPVPPDFEIATKRVVASGSCASSAA